MWSALYYFEQTSDDIVTVELNPPPPGVQRDSDNNKVDNQSWAAFTQWTFEFSDMFAATVGGRYTEDKKDAFPDQYRLSRRPTSSRFPSSGTATPSARSRRPRSLQLNWNENAMTYLSYSEGFKGGGWNSHFNAVLTAEQQAALASVRAGRGTDHRARHQARPRGQYAAPEPGGLHV